MKNNIPKKSKSERAQSLVEFAISLLLILMILAGAVELSLALFEYVTISNAAQEGALYGSINARDHDAIKARVIDAANDGLTLTPAEISISVKGTDFCEKTTSGVTNMIMVAIVHPHQIVMPFASSFLGTQINLTVSAKNTILSPACP